MREGVARTRIGRVRLKNGPEVVRFPTPAADKLCRTLEEHARMIAVNLTGEMAGFVVIGWDTRGRYSLGWRVLADSYPITATLAPAFVHDVLLRERIESALIQG